MKNLLERLLYVTFKSFKSFRSNENFKSPNKQIYQKGCNHKRNKKRIKLITSDEKYPQGKKNYLHIKIWFTFKNRKNFCFLRKTNFLKVNLETYTGLTRNCKLFLIITLWSYSKCKDLLHTLNLYKIRAKEHKAVDHCTVDELSVL